MKLEWDFPVYSTEWDRAKHTGTYSKSERVALPRDEAMRYIAGDDPRPLVVVRECGWCEGSDDALLSSRLDNEKTLLLSHWFHMVKLPNHVLEDDHPFRNLFEGDEPPHLFVATADGALSVPLTGQQSQTELWHSLQAVLEATYENDPDEAVKRIYRILDRFDQLDDTDALLTAKLNDEIEKRGVKSSKLKKIRKSLDKLESTRKSTWEELEKLRDLGLKEAATEASEV